MKKFVYILLMILPVLLLSCSEDDLSGTSVIKDAERTETQLDNWLKTNYLNPYNVDFKYRMEDIESDNFYNLVPAKYEQSIRMAKIVKYLCLEAYDSLTGDEKFVRQHFPKVLHIIGSAAYDNNGTMILGTAEGGYKITLFYINNINTSSVADVNRYSLRTIHHEFAHIFHQKKPYSTSFREISGSKYVSDSWNDVYTSENTSLPAGFITPYAAKAHDEDFVEIIANYVTNTAAAWEAKLVKAGTTGRPIIESKFDIVYNYMFETWNVDLHKLRDIVIYRQSKYGELDLNNID